MGCLHDPANVQQFTCILNTFAGSLLDRVNTLLLAGKRANERDVKTRTLRSCKGDIWCWT